MAFLSGAPGPGELLVVFVAVLLLFGPRKLPGIARTIGQIMQQLRRASDDFKEQLMSVEEEVRAEVREVVDTSKEAFSEEWPDRDESVPVESAPETMPEVDVAQTDEAPLIPSALPNAASGEERPLGG